VNIAHVVMTLIQLELHVWLVTLEIIPLLREPVLLALPELIQALLHAHV